VPVEPSATLVTVDKTPITRAQLELTIERTLGESAPLFANEEVERKILESLVSSRAMALLAERELDASEREQLDLKAQAYREELLVRHYLEAHANPEPVTAEQVADYYNRHQDEFGGGVEKSFEIIASDQELEPAQRTELITLLSGPQVQGKDWQKLVADWRQAGKPLQYRQSRLKLEMLEQPLRSLVEPTAAGNIAPLYVDGQLMTGALEVLRSAAGTPLALQFWPPQLGEPNAFCTRRVASAGLGLSVSWPPHWKVMPPLPWVCKPELNTAWQDSAAWATPAIRHSSPISSRSPARTRIPIMFAPALPSSLIVAGLCAALVLHSSSASCTAHPLPSMPRCSGF